MPSGSLPVKCLNLSISNYSKSGATFSGVTTVKTWGCSFRRFIAAEGTYSMKLRNQTNYSANILIAATGLSGISIPEYVLNIKFGTASSLTTFSNDNYQYYNDEFTFGTGLSLYVQFGASTSELTATVQITNMNLNFYYI